MPNYKAVVRFQDVPGPDVLSARKTLEERIQASGLDHWRVVDIVQQDTRTPRRALTTARWRADRDFAAKLMLTGAALWAVWFFWVLVD